MSIKIKDIKLFEWVDVEYIAMIIDNSRRIEKKANDVIIHEWAESNGCAYIIQEWIVRVEMNWTEISKLKEWDFFWEMALINVEVRTASIIANTDVILLQIDKELLHTIIKKFKNWFNIQRTFMERILNNVRNTNSK